MDGWMAGWRFGCDGMEGLIMMCVCCVYQCVSVYLHMFVCVHVNEWVSRTI